MKIVKAQIKWCDGYMNAPRVQVLVDKLPALDDLIYERKGPLYFAEKDGYVQFYYYSAPGNGFGGHTFRINVKNEGMVDLIGPWASRASAMNACGFVPSMGVSITDDAEAYDRGHTFFSAAITVEKAKEVVEKISGSSILKYTFDGDVRYVISKVGSPNPGTTIEVIK